MMIVTTSTDDDNDYSLMIVTTSTDDDSDYASDDDSDYPLRDPGPCVQIDKLRFGCT